MARKKPVRTRKQEFKARQRKSWMSFLTKVAFFAIPVIGLTVWLILFLLGSGQTLPILTLDFAQTQEQRGNEKTWKRINYRLNKNTGFELPDQLDFGGPNNDALVIFNDLLGSAKSVGENGRPIACIFEPSTDEEHQTHGFRGLLSDDTTAEANQWVPFEDYLQKIVDAVSAKATVKNGRGKIILVLDIDHPDIPGQLPPQANLFVKLCKEQWKTARDKLGEKNDVYVWLSHSEGQMSYYDSDFSKVESFFKHRFDRAITGDVLNLKGRVSQNDVYYSDLKNYLKKWVESDSNIHKLAQTPTFLEPAGADNAAADFPILRFQRNPPDESLFDYVSRDASDNTMENLWKRFEATKIEHDWNLENPLLVQRSTLLLLQLEKLWYAGKRKSDLFGDLSAELDALIKTTTTIEPVQHTLYDALASDPKTVIQPIDPSWLAQPSPAATTEPPTTDDPARKTPEELAKENAASLSTWRNKSPNWAGAMGVWQTFRDNQVSKQVLAAALNQLTPAQKLIKRNEDGGNIEISETAWNEIAYLDRLANELAWPTETNELANFKKLIQESIQARDLANRIQAELTPVLCLKFGDAFEQLENQRRLFEDRLFANDQLELATGFENLATEYKKLATRQQRLKTEFEMIQQQLISAPHDLRYCLESLAVQAQNGVDVASRQTVVQQFEDWAKGDQGFQGGWEGLGSQMIGAMMDADPATKRTATFQKVRKGGFPNHGSPNDNSKGFASNPYLDFVDFSSLNVDMGSADGNLLARRLLLWPNLDSAIRENIRTGLSTKRVSQSGNTDESANQNPTQETSSTQEGRVFDFDNSEIADRLAKVFDGEPMQLLSRTEEPIKFERGNENFFIRAAFGAHRLFVKRDDETADNLVVATNDFRSEKSNLDFQRVASDLWATPVSSSGTPYALAALTNHNNLVDIRIQQMPGLEPLKMKLAEIWNSGPKKDWPARTKQVETFGDNFNRWEWMQQTQKARNSSLASSIETEKQHDNQLLFTLSPKELLFDQTIKGEFDNENNWLDHAAIPGNSLRVYLRGHQTIVGVSRRPPDPKSVPYDVTLETSNARGAQLVVKRVSEGPVSGHITLVIDCSKSMGGSGMQKAKDDLVLFLEQISNRGDISVSLVAIGATESFNASTETWDYRPRTELPNWKQDGKNDVWVYEGQGEIVDDRSLPGLKKAISELNHYGETPILAGLDKALSMTQGRGSQANLVVLLTDGFEFGNRNRKANEDYAPFDTQLYSRVSQRLNTGAELVVFSFLTKSIGDSFRSMIDSGFPETEIKTRISRIESLATINKQASQTSLHEFFKGLLPQPKIFVIGDGDPPLKEIQTVKDGMDRNGDGRISDEERRIMAAIELGADQRPNQWSAGVEFSQTVVSDAAKSFAKQPTAWSTDTRIVGNEILEFAYDPFRPSFNLTTASVSDAQRIQWSGHPLLVSKTSNRLRKPEFEIASEDGKQLTPAPAIAFLTLDQKDDKQSVLIQDFNLRQQPRSNVHPLEFPEFKDALRRATFSGNEVNLQLNLIKEFTPQFWTKIEFSERDPWSVTNDGSKKQEMKQGDYVSLAKLLPDTKQFNDYEIEIRRDNTDINYADFWIRIEPKLENTPIDRWLVQVIGDDGQIDRKIKKTSQRRYVYRENPDGTQKLIHIEHHFTIIKRELLNSKAYLGFANIDYMTDIEIGKVQYPNYFKE